MNTKRLIRKAHLCVNIVKAEAQASFSQLGEDLIVNYLFNSLNILDPTYLDIGTNHPVVGNNTYFFYTKGSKGVCIEPDPDLHQLIERIRPHDKVLNIGIGLQKTANGNLHIFPKPYTGWNTFSPEEAAIREKESGIRVKEVRNIPMVPINDIIDKYFDVCPNFLSIDVEGLDYQILQTLDFNQYKPEVICAETISFSLNRRETKIQSIIDLISDKGYFVYADTHVNSIFCRNDLLSKE